MRSNDAQRVDPRYRAAAKANLAESAALAADLSDIAWRATGILNRLRKVDTGFDQSHRFHEIDVALQRVDNLATGIASEHSNPSEVRVSNVAAWMQPLGAET